MSYSLDADILLGASDELSEWHAAAEQFVEARVTDPEILWLT